MAKVQGQARDSRREARWRGVMAEFGKSGLTVRGFCARQRLSEPSFYHWRRVIRERAAQGPQAADAPMPSSPAFVPMVVRDGAEHSDAGIVIQLRGGRVMRLPAALPVRQVAELVHAIEADVMEAQS
jgi:hypothetical protein